MIVPVIAALLMGVGATAYPLCKPSTQAVQNPDGTPSDIVVIDTSLVTRSSSSAFDVVFIGEGFTQDEYGFFEAKASEAIAFLSRPPFSGCVFNFYKVFLSSNESGADHPRDCPPKCKDTPLDATFGVADPNDRYFDERFLLVDTRRAIDAAELAACGSDYDQIVVLVNDAAYGAIADSDNRLLTVSVGQSFENNLLHEMGHTFAGLGDEYTWLDYGYPQCIPNSCRWIEEPNVTGDGLPEKKWDPTFATDAAFVRAPVSGDLVGLLINDPRFSGMSECALKEQVGFWEGAMGWPKGAYRPQFTCKMRVTAEDFCAVCTEAIKKAVASRCPEGVTAVDVSLLAESFQCMVGITVTVALPPCLKCLIATEEEANGGMDLSETDIAVVDIGPLPDVEKVDLIEVKPQGSRRLVTREHPQPSGPFFKVKFGINPDAHYYIEFSPVRCVEPRLVFSVGLSVNGQSVDL